MWLLCDSGFHTSCFLGVNLSPWPPSLPASPLAHTEAAGREREGPVDSLGRALSHPGLCSQFFTSGGKEASHKVSYRNETPSPLQLGLVQKRTDRGQAVPSEPSYPQGTCQALDF